MNEPLFDPEKCNVPEVPKLDFDFVSECSIPAPPPPIFDCQAPMVPRDPPPVPCPVFDAQAVVRSAIARDSCSISDGSEAATFVITQTDNDPCRFFLDLDLVVPIPQVPCPTFEDGSVTMKVGYKDCVPEASGVIKVTKEVIPGDCETQDSCKYTLDLDLAIPIPKVPCPTFEDGSVTMKVGYKDCVPEASGVIKVTKEVIPGTCSEADSCKYTLDLDLAIPIPKVPCPTFSSGAVTIAVDYSGCILGPTGVINVTKEVIPGTCSEADSCKYTLDLDLAIPIPPPPCPEIKSTGAISINELLSQPTMVFGVVTTKAQSGCQEICKFDLDIDIEIPNICPEIKVTGAIEKDPLLDNPTMVFTVTKDPATCKFDFDLDIAIPDICPEITATSAVTITPGRDEPSAVLKVTKDPDPDKCEFEIDLAMEFPPARPCPEYTGVVTIYEATEPTGVITLTLTPPTAPDEPCFYDIDLELGVPICVPEFTTKTNIFCTPGRNDITCTKFQISGPGPSDCKYVAQLDIEFPCPRPCPTISGVVTVFEASALTGVLTVTHETPPTAAAACVYDLDLQIGLRPSNKLEKGTVVADWTVCTGTPTCDVVIDPPDDNGIQKIHIDIRVPQPPSYAGGMIDLGALGSGNITIDAADPCNRVINAKIDLNTTSCPT